MDDAIKRALEVAGEAIAGRVEAAQSLYMQPDPQELAAAAIAAFLEALPENTAYTMVPLPLELAAAVRRAAGGG